ncbi:MAG: helix-turn-helix domain-containing protein [Sphingomonadales bacterium]
MSEPMPQYVPDDDRPDNVTPLPLAGGFRRDTLGAMLAAARARTGKDLADIAQETRVPLRHLRALEADDHAALPALPYATGFVRAFARAVGLDGDAMAQQFRGETQLAPHEPAPEMAVQLEQRRLPSGAVVIGSAGVIVALLVGLGLYGSGAFDPPPAAPLAAVPVASAPVTPPPATATPAPALTPADAVASNLPAAAPPVAAAPTAPAAGAVVITARQDAWVRIYDRFTGRRVFQGIMTAGQSFAVPATEANLLLRTGRAGALVLSVDGKALPALGGPVQTVDRVPLTAAGLAARFAPPPVYRPQPAPSAATGGAPAAATDAAPLASQPPVAPQG